MVPAYCANRLCWVAGVFGVWASLFAWLVGALPLRVRIGIIAYALVTSIVPSALLPKDLAEDERSVKPLPDSWYTVTALLFGGGAVVASFL